MSESFSHKRDLLGHMKNKQRLMQLCFRARQTCRGRDSHRLVMGRRVGLMEHMVVGLIVGTCQIKMIPLEMEYS